MFHGTFATALNCMDGRAQEVVVNLVKKKTKVDFVDMITEPGVDKILSLGKNKKLVDWIKNKINISVEKHGSRFIAIVGHYDCAGNPVDEKTHKKQIKKAVEKISNWYKGKKVEVAGLWLDEKFRGNWI